MKIAYLYSRFPVVSQTFCLTEMLALERQGVSLSVASLYPPPPGVRHGALRNLQAEVAYAPPQSVLKIWEEIARDQRDWPAALIKRHDRAYGPENKSALRARNALFFADRFARQGVDHFHVHFANRAAHTAIFLKKLSGIPFSITAHAQDYQTQLGSNHALLREMCKEAKFVVAVSEYSRQVLAGICPESEAKIIRVYNGIELGRFGSGDSALENAVPKILSIGRLIDIKGFRHLIGACALLKEREIPFECEIVGEGPLQPAIEEAIAKRGLQDCVRLAGALSQEEVARLLIGCDVFTLACIEEADGACDVLPTVILEAMAAGRPVVSTRLAGIPEMVEEGVTGLLVPPGGESELADALSALLRDASLRREYGQAGRQKAEAVFHVEKTSAQLKALLDRHTASPKELKPEPAVASACLLQKWSSEWRPAKAPESFARIYAFKAEPRPAGSNNSSLRSVKQIDFLPDDSVLEAEWSQEPEWAARIEACRSELCPGLDNVAFHRQARRALWLLKALKRGNIRHLHAVGSRAHLCALILRKLCGATVSCNVASDAGSAKIPFLNKLASALGGE